MILVAENDPHSKAKSPDSATAPKLDDLLTQSSTGNTIGEPGIVTPAEKLEAGDFIPVGKNEVIIMSPLPADFYLKLPNDHFILVGRRGDKKLGDLHAIRTEQQLDLFVLREDYKNCVGANLQIAEIAISREELSDLKKVDFLFRASDSVMKEIEELGFNHESLAHAKIVSQSIVTLVAAKPEINMVLQLMGELSNELVRHSMAVSAISVIMAKQMNWTIQATIQKLALGALLHDIGLKEIPPELFLKPRHAMNPGEMKEYESHVMRGVQILSTIPDIPTEVVSIAMEHHENAIGQGYPRHLRDVKIHPFSRVVSVADAFCYMTMNSSMNPNPRPAPEAIKYIDLTLGQPYSKPAFAALKQALNIAVPVKKNVLRTG